MNIGYVVIGAGYGDEGKGLMTDYLVRKHDAHHVVRFNGGAQAGHTVETPDGRRHVFGHVGAGTFAGARTILGPKFIINPLVLEKEAKALGGDFIKPIAFADAPISTIYDMILNIAAERARGAKRHGSCGMGINETVTRHASYPVTFNSPHNRAMFYRIRDEYVPRRLQELGNPELTDDMELILGIDPGVHYTKFKDLANTYISTTIGQSTAWKPESAVIFEGAQGLMLDEFMGDFPHVTRSMTGLPQAIHAASLLNIQELRPVYVTRCYKTRHGAGPLRHEGEVFSSTWKNTDKTNVDNPHQGSIRFAPLNIAELGQVISKDLERSKVVANLLGVSISEPSLAVTCLDQIGDDFRFYENKSTPRIVETRKALMMIDTLLGVNLGYASFGPTHAHVVEAADL